MKYQDKIYPALAIIALMVMVGIGSVNQWQAIPILVIVLTFAFIIGSKWINPKYYPFILYGIAVATLWQVSMLGTYIVGTDIHVELHIVKKVLAGTIEPMAEATTSSSSVTLRYIVPLLQKMGFPVIWQFKALYPALFAFVPPMLYFMFRKVISKKYAYLSVLFIIISPMFSVGMTSSIRGMVSQTFWVAFLFTWFCIKYKRIKYPAMFLSLIIAVCSHYATTSMIGIIIFGALGIAVITYIFRRKRLWYPAIASIMFIVVIFGWYGLIGHGKLLNYYVDVARSLLNVSKASISETINGETEAVVNVDINDPIIEPEPEGKEPVEKEFVEKTNSKLVDIIDKPEELVTEYNKYTNPQDITGTYLDNQPPLVRTALGLDFLTASTGGKLFRLVQFAMQGMIIIGVVTIVRKKDKNYSDYNMTALMIAAMILLLITLFVPYFGTKNSVTRIYLFTLYILAPSLMLYVYYKWDKHKAVIKTVIICCLVGYYIFTSGIVFELIGGHTKHVNMPYSIALSNKRLSIAGVFTDDDLYVAQVVVNKKLPAVYADYHGAVLLKGFGYNGGIHQVQETGKADYVLLTSINDYQDGMIYGTMPGLRWKGNIPEYWLEGEVMVQSGDSKIIKLED